MAGAAEIILGDGVFAIWPTSSAGVDIALTRGGGEFSLNREIRRIEADGDYGAVAGRMRKTMVEPTLTMRALEILDTNAKYFYPGSGSSSSAGSHTLQGSTGGISVFGTTSTDEGYFRLATWTGETKDAEDVII